MDELPDVLFSYRPLAPQSIRLITIEMVHTHDIYCTQDLCIYSSSSLIRCSMKHVQWEENVKFHTLSYTWGPSRLHAPIVLNDCTIHVTENLAYALDSLRRFRHVDPKEVFPIWIDAICINQKDDVEKREQIAQMKTTIKRPKVYGLGLDLRLAMDRAYLNI
jgi:hypothetical protein